MSQHINLIVADLSMHMAMGRPAVALTAGLIEYIALLRPVGTTEDVDKDAV
jgi:hypothetical protein